MDVEVSVAKGAASLYVASLIILVLNTIYFIILTNVLPAPVVGFVSLLNVIIPGVVTVASFSLPVGGTGVSAAPPAATRFISQYLAEGKGNAARRLFVITAFGAAVISTVIAGFLALPTVSSRISSPLNPEPVLFAAVDSVILSIGQVGAFSLIGAGRAARAGSITAAAAFVKYLAASVLLLEGSGPSGVFLGFAMGDLVLAVATLTTSSRSIRSSGESGIERKAILTYMLSILASAMIGYGVAQTDRFLAFFQRGFSDLAVYNAASVGAAVAAFAPMAVTNVLVPILASLREEEASKRKLILRNYTRYVSFVALPMGFGLAAIAPSLLRLFGENYVSGSPLIAVIGICVALTSVGSVYSSILLSSKRTLNFLIGNCIALISLVVVSFVLVPIFGLSGLAIARGVMFLVAALVFALFVRRMGEFVLDVRGYAKALLGSAIMGGTVYSLLYLATSTLAHTRSGSVAAGVLLVPAGAFVYLAVMKVLRAFSERDLEFAEQLLPRSFAPLFRLVKRLLL